MQFSSELFVLELLILRDVSLRKLLFQLVHPFFQPLLEKVSQSFGQPVNRDSAEILAVIPVKVVNLRIAESYNRS